MSKKCDFTQTKVDKQRFFAKVVTRELLGCSVAAYWSKSCIFVIKIVSVINSSSDSTLQLNKTHNMIIHICSTNGVVELWTKKRTKSG